MKLELWKDGELSYVEIPGEAAPPAGPPPGVLAKIRHFSAAFARWRAAGFPRRARAEVAACLAICAACPHWHSRGNLGLGECRHPHCGCSRFKPGWATEHCPLGHW